MGLMMSLSDQKPPNAKKRSREKRKDESIMSVNILNFDCMVCFMHKIRMMATKTSVKE